MVQYYLNHGAILAYRMNHLVVPVMEKDLLNIIVAYPQMWAEILEGRARHVKRDHPAKYVFLATHPMTFRPGMDHSVSAMDHSVSCIASVLKFVMQKAIEEDVSCFILMKNKLVSREIFRTVELEYPTQEIKPRNLCVTTVDELCHLTKDSIHRPGYVIIVDFVASYHAIDESSDNETLSGRHMLHWLVWGASKVILVDEVTDIDEPLPAHIPKNNVEVDNSDGVRFELLKLMKTFSDKYGRGSYWR